MSELIRELWAGEPPVSAVNTLQTYILRIRRTLDVADVDRCRDSGKAMLATYPASYLLRIAPGQLDLDEFDELVREATEDFEREDYGRSADRLEMALELHNGPVLTDVPIGPRLTVHVARLEEAILRARELRIEADLRSGRHRKLVSDLAGLVVEHPTNERLHGHFMIALCGSGRRAEALELYQRLRKRLVDELGIEPTDWLSHIQQAILAGDLDVTGLLAGLPAQRRTQEPAY